MPDQIAQTYRRFAEIEAQGVSATYFDWATSISGDAEVCELIAELPGIKRQPNLIFAAARWLGAPVGPYADFRDWLISRWHDVVPVILSRATQTNEAGRCAVLLPVLAGFDGPLALIEAGASAGLVLYPDRYSYAYDTGEAVTILDPPEGPSRVRIPCAIDAESVPSRLPQITWRAGADLNPIDAGDADAVDWLETLIWPEHDARRQRLREAARIAAADPPRLVAGDIVDTIPDLVAAAPENARVVVFHSAVLVYLTPERRQQFADLMESMPQVTWISNEGPGVLPGVTQRVTREIDGRTILAVNADPVALVGPHGQSFQRL